MPDAPGRIAFRFEGRVVPASPGQSLAAALTAAGQLTLGTGKDGSPRGAFCGMGVCHDCLVVVDGRAGQRACLTAARDGLDVGRQPLRPDIADPRLRPPAEPAAGRPDRACDLLVVGAGPAGLAAAVAARRAGAAVLLVDERPSPGGQYYKQPATADERARADRQARRGAALVARVRALGVAILSGTAVWGAERRPDGTLAVAVLTEGEAPTLLPRALVVATGAYERAPILPGWTLPGVMTSGALQTMLRADGAVPPGRILVAGNGPLNIQVAVEALRRGARVVGVVEAAASPGSGSGAGLALLRADPRLAAAGLAALARLRAAGVPVHWGHRVVGVAGEGRAERARIAPVAGGAGFELAAEIVALGEGFAPAGELSRLLGCRHAPDGRGGLSVARDADGRTSLPDVFVAGEAGRFGGARVAEAEGTLAGRAAARGLGFAVAGGDAALRRALARHERFQAALWRLFDAPHPALERADDATVLCRCEALTLGTLRAAVRRHAVADLPTLKRLTRAGMGRCQGRYCAPALAALLETLPGDERGGFAPQMPLRPVPLAALAGERGEWDGHRRSLLPAWTHGASLHEAPRDAEVAIVGAGIAGLSTALFLARAGCDALVIERSEPNALASGGNAGSLHAQLLSFDHGARAAGAGGPAARTLPLQRDSIALWAELQRELGADFEMAVTGGLMVAETERDLDFLRAKTAVERAQGVDSEVIDAAALRALEPALSERFLGAALCPAEGKINPLVATQAILAAAEAAGARVLRRAAVTGIARDGRGGFHVATSRGPVRARRIVNAAGAFASTVARMLGADLPVHGAPLQMIVTEPAAPTLGRLVAHADRHLTLKQASNGAFIIGGGWTAGLDLVHGHPRPLLSSLAGNLWVAQRVVPRLDRLHVLRSWAAMNIDIDGAPILGEDPRVPGLFHAVTSNGYTLGPLVGRLTADLVARGTTDRDLRAFSVARFSDAAV